MQKRVFLILEYAANGEVYKELTRRGTFEEALTAKYASPHGVSLHECRETLSAEQIEFASLSTIRQSKIFIVKLCRQMLRV